MQCVDRHQLLLRHLMIKLAPVLLGVKPAGMVRLTNCGRIGGGAQCDLFSLHQREILEALHLECRILRNDGIDLVVLFFRRAVLERTLASSEAAGFLNVFVPGKHPGLFHDLMGTPLLHETAEEIESTGF